MMGRMVVGVDEDATDHDSTWEGDIDIWRDVNVWTVAKHGRARPYLLGGN